MTFLMFKYCKVLSGIPTLADNAHILSFLTLTTLRARVHCALVDGGGSKINCGVSEREQKLLHKL